ncbi:putative response regulator receiver (CheY-like protein) [Bradyrhizobium sp. STM 3843]|uniref:response regulator n=1 Tax=Bradyrhizobium sp. STM 3843 TaxID=551947 RepID=UPI000240AF2C|nr:response regulator [Bradyrhizobium sp. STM 3843]CCE05719.1 putative response regulator receiver (CheY-like protein) [Bradyrhizobium sp. STM 3843]
MRNELLVIEDADVHLSILRKIAAQAGFNTTGVNSVEGACTLLRRQTFDCITLDLSLGERSGIEVLELLAELKCRAPVIIISASDDKALAETVRIGNFLSVNVRPPFAKPINLQLLRETLKQIATDTERQKLVRSAGW